MSIHLLRGVKQGDPLSPYIFNAIINPLLEQLERLKGLSIDDSHNISSLAFTDDLILLADNHTTAQKLLAHTELYLKKLSMSIAAPPSRSPQLKTLSISLI